MNLNQIDDWQGGGGITWCSTWGGKYHEFHAPMMCQACEYIYLVRCIVFMCNTQTHPQTVVHRVCISQVTMSTFVSAGKKQMNRNRITHTQTHNFVSQATLRTHRHLVWIFRPILSSSNTIKYILVHHCGFSLLNSHCHVFTCHMVHGNQRPQTNAFSLPMHSPNYTTLVLMSSTLIRLV